MCLYSYTILHAVCLYCTQTYVKLGVRINHIANHKKIPPSQDASRRTSLRPGGAGLRHCDSSFWSSEALAGAASPSRPRPRSPAAAPAASASSPPAAAAEPASVVLWGRIHHVFILHYLRHSTT